MKLRKLTALLLGAAVLASAAVPMASAEAANVNINVQPEFFSPNAGISESFSEDGAVTLTIDDATASGTGGLMMWPDYANKENTLSLLGGHWHRQFRLRYPLGQKRRQRRHLLSLPQRARSCH